jgi:hypothetical protein
MPDFERTISKSDDRVTVYSFSDENLRRFATVGAATVRKSDGRATNFELFMVLPVDLAGANLDAVASLLFDVFTYGLKDDVQLQAGYVIPPSPLVPPQWNTRALLIDEPVGEPEDIATIHIRATHIDVWWVVPIYESEFQFIRMRGAEAFYELADAAERSLADPRRPPLVRMTSASW